MTMLKRFSVLILVALFAVPAVMGQSGQSKDEMSIEESYLQESIEIMIIQETSHATSRDQKMIALEHIGQALDRGSTNEEVRKALEYLSLEGKNNQTHEGRRSVTNYPDVRREAVKYLAKVNNAEAKTALIKVCVTDDESSVIQEAIKSLGIIGMNDNNDAIDAIVMVAKKDMNSTKPDSMVGVAVAETLEKLAEKNKSISSEAIQLLGRMATDSQYPTPVKTRARLALTNVQKYVNR